MIAYHRVYDSRHLKADCQEPGSAPEPYARQSSMGYSIKNSSSPCLQAKLDSGCCLFYKVKFSSGIFAKKLLRNAAMRLGLWLALPAGIVEAMSTGLCGPLGTILEFIFTPLKCEASSTQCPKWRHCVWRVWFAIALYSRSYRVDQKSGATDSWP